MSDNILSVNATRGGKIECTVLEVARGKQLQGSLCKVEVKTGHVDQTMLCRIGTIDTVSKVHCDVNFAPIIAKRGRIDYISGDADIETTKLEIVACVDAHGKIAGRKANPPSGTLAATLEAGDLTQFQQEKEFYFNAGYMPGYPEVNLSIINRHYGNVVDPNGKDIGGWDEAKFRIYFGQNGSGKTIYLLEHCAARLAMHPGLGLLAIDTKGDLVVEDKHRKHEFDFSFHDLLKDAGRSYRMVKVSDIRLTSHYMIVNLLGERFHRRLGKEKKTIELVMDTVITTLTEDKDVDINLLTLDRITEGFADMIGAGFGWSTTKGKERENFITQIRGLAQASDVVRFWDFMIKPYYTGRYTARELAEMVLSNGEIVLLEMRSANGEGHQAAIVRELIKKIRSEATKSFKMGKTVNAEVILDEAHRWVPQIADDNPFAKEIIDSVNTTRAYGVSWTFATQRITSIDKSVLAQMHTRYYMRGLFAGADMVNMETDLGKDGVELYRSLQLDGSYFCLASGQEVNFGAGTGAVAFIGWAGEVNNEVKSRNLHIWKNQDTEKVKW